MDKILFIVGSERKGSFNRQLSDFAEKDLEGKAEVVRLDFSDVPFLNQDDEFPAPAPVARVREAVKDADGIFLFTPEYNQSIPGLVKNLFDWLSRVVTPGVPTVVTGKPIVFASAAGRDHGANATNEAIRLCKFIGMDIVDVPAVNVAVAGGWVSGVLEPTDEEKAALDKAGTALLAEIDSKKA